MVTDPTMVRFKKMLELSEKKHGYRGWAGLMDSNEEERARYHLTRTLYAPLPGRITALTGEE